MRRELRVWIDEVIRNNNIWNLQDAAMRLFMSFSFVRWPKGAQRGRGGKEEEISIDGGGAFSSSIYVHGIKVFLSLLWNFSAGVLFVHDCAQDSFYSKKMFDGPF